MSEKHKVEVAWFGHPAANFSFFCGFGFFWYAWTLHGFWWGCLYGAFWPCVVGYHWAQWVMR
jgi:hypothetical protein